ncbi:MAG: orotate phosphoribosyltransferase [Bacteroidetes bacterium CG2_30_32_10]|nr:MAG: orotate phosphoribosyltransferase [Bacteroidetes bacterium CG2_30_32_10]
MKKNEESSLKVSEYLLQIKAIKLNIAKPYTWASGWKSPIYCDNRKTLSYPQIRNFIRDEMVKLIREEYGEPEVIAGVATAGIPLGVLVAQDLGLPFIYVRSEEKKHGLENQIEGVLEANKAVVIIEDLVSTGMSSLKAVDAIKNAGANVKGMAAIFTYGFKTASNNFSKAKCPLVTLTNYDNLIAQALDSGYIQANDLITLKKWRETPEKWGI